MNSRNGQTDKEEYNDQGAARPHTIYQGGIEMKAYESMNVSENLGWCKCYLSRDESKHLVVNEGENAGTNLVADEYAELSPLDIEAMIEAHELHECGCPKCPYRDVCEAMIVG